MHPVSSGWAAEVLLESAWQSICDEDFANPEAARTALRQIAAWWQESCAAGGILTAPDEPPAWAATLQRVLREAPLREAVLVAIAGFIRNARSGFDPFQLFSRSPRALEVLARLACGSPFLTQTLLSDPQCLAALTLHGRTADTKDREQFIHEAQQCLLAATDRPARLRELRRYQRRQLLRIGMCDAFGLMDLKFITLQLSLLADAMVQCSLELAAAECGTPADQITVIALGKLGGEELNYSSDIDLVLICSQQSPQTQRLARLMVDNLTDNSPPGFLYRVDLRLRPWGEAGPLVSEPAAYAAYLAQHAELWEKQAMLKARPIAGSAALGTSFLENIRPLLFTASEAQILAGVQAMKSKIEQRLKQRGKLYSEVKLGAGSIRDIEFLVQALQLIHGMQEPRVLTANTLDALVRQAEFGLISAHWYRQLRTGYVFLRTVEHSLQLLHNQQTHELPTDSRQLQWLAHRLDYPDAATLMARFEEHRVAVRTIFEQCLRVESARAGTPESLTGRLAAGSADSLPDDRNVSAESLPDKDDLLHLHAGRLTDLAAKADQCGGCAVEQCSPAVAGETSTTRPVSGASAAVSDLLVAGVDFSGWLSVICGLLSVYQLDIRSGDAATGAGLRGVWEQRPEGYFAACFRVRMAKRPVAGSAAPSQSLADRLQQEIGRLGAWSRDGRIEEVRAELISRFCAAVPDNGRRTTDAEDSELTVELNPLPGSVLTEMKICGEDSWGFFYELASALSLSRFRVLRAVIRSDGRQVRDILHVRERNGLPIASEERRQELRLAATLIKQFTHWLPTASDPHHALLRFRDLVSRLQPASAWESNQRSLQKPAVLHAVARVLGISQYLWDTFLRSGHEELFPLLAHSEQLAAKLDAEVLRHQLSNHLAGPPANLTAINGQPPDIRADRWQLLNDFKDRHLFRIDMRHVLGHCRPFGAFSRELTELAELIVQAAADIAWRELTAAHGTPACAWMIAGLGKFGGVEMGFASDLELMLVYAAEGRTAGPSPLTNAQFFERLVRLVEHGIRAPQDGIFHVDLRIRPYGQAGPAAVRLNDLQAYYESGGPAWPYERQALVRLRAVAGDVPFGRQVTETVQQLVYAHANFDFAAMNAMRERQVRQLVRGGTINAKLSDGGLVDCEYAVQALQLVFGGRHAALRSPSTLTVLHNAREVGLVTAKQQKAVENAYVFLRELIDCLRMARGNAKDLTVPASGSRDWLQLSSRMSSIHDSTIPLDSLEEQMTVVREFARHVERLCHADLAGRQ